MIYLLTAPLVLGHFVACIFVINRLHATALPYALLKLIDIIWYTTLFGVPALLLYCLLFGPPLELEPFRQSVLQLLIGLYTVVCGFAAIAVILLIVTAVTWR